MVKNQSTQYESFGSGAPLTKMEPRLSVIIPTHRRARFVSNLLHALSEQTLPSSELEILVVSNLEDPELERKIQEGPPLPLRYLVRGRKGVNSARNLGLQAARGEIILFLDDDCLPPDPNYLGRHLQTHWNEPHWTGLGGAYLLPKSYGWIEEYYHLHNQFWIESSLGRDGRTSVNLLGGNSSYKRSHLETHQIQFDEAIQYGGAEVSFNHRLLHSGAEIAFSNQLGVIHAARIGLKALLKKAFYQGCGLRKRVEDGVHPPSRYLARPVSFIEFLRTRAKPHRPILFLKLLNVCYDFFFQVGYRYQDLKNYRPRTALLRAWSGELTATVIKFLRSSFINEAYLLIKAKWVNLNSKR